MAGSDRLVEISPEDWTELKILFRSDWPKHEFAYHMLETYIKWNEQHQTTGVQCYSLNGNWRVDETFVLKDGFEIYFYSTAQDENSSLLIRLLLQIEWQSFSEVSMDFLDKFHQAILKVISEKHLKVVTSNLANYYYLSKEQAFQLHSPSLPEGYVFEKITLKDLDHIYDQWPLRTHISYESGYGLLKRLISFNDSVGLFNEKGQIISWCLSDQTGAHSDLQTMPAFRRKGYGRIVVIELAKRLALAGSDSKAYVLHGNENSIRLFESVGFKKMQNLHWMVASAEQ
ncbi:uncharacterized protein LOC128723340 [Anopheles nili]|uniref:uncharacterized protein LOC128723340 n=1 Tax=Anopheles nili TaxID=185578 RepID=UPI00237ACFA9|nr:uncharacterized protein LOC128723340 [Anopheles nili]